MNNNTIRMLLIEDNPGDAFLMKTNLEHARKENGPAFEVLEAGTLASAIDILDKETRIDIILIDLSLPDSNGLITLVKINEFIRSKRKGVFFSTIIPIIVMTGYNNYELALESLKMGAQDYLIKGEADAETLNRSIAYALERQALLVELEKAYITLNEEIKSHQTLQTELKSSEEKFYLISSMAADAIVLMDAEGKISFWNHAAEVIFGYESAEITGHVFYEKLISENYAEFFKKEFRQLRNSNKSIFINNIIETPMIRKDGREIQAEFSLSSINIGGQMHSAAIVRDITGRKKIELELQKARDEADNANRAKSEFLANMSHEIRTPITSVIGMADLLDETQLTDDQRDLISIIKESAGHLLTIINDVLDISRIESGKLSLQNVKFNLIALIESVTEIITMKVKEKKLKLKATVAPGIPEELLGDPVRLKQVLLNFLSNAVKFTENGEVCLHVRLMAYENPYYQIKFEVNDTGIGISDEKVNLLFEPFSQLDMSSTKRYAGAGLGLAISKRLADLMGAKLGVESKAGCGSKFWLLIALESARPSPQLLKEDWKQKGHERYDEKKMAFAKPLPAAPAVKKNILLAEDNIFNQKLITSNLARTGYILKSVSNGRDAVDEALKNDYALIIMDCQMPVMDGYMAARAIRQNEAGTKKHVPIIALTADAMEGTRENCIRAGMDDYFTKPIDFGTLITAIKKLTSVAGENTGHQPAVKSAGAAEPSKTGAIESIDMDTIKKLSKLQIEGKPDIILELIKIFVEDAQPKIKDIGAAIKKGEAGTVAALAHYIKSSSANIGALRLSRLCQELEKAGKNDMLPECEKIYNIIELEYTTVSKDFNLIIKEGGCLNA